MVLDPIPQPLPVHFFGSRPQPPTSLWMSQEYSMSQKRESLINVSKESHIYVYICLIYTYIYVSWMSQEHSISQKSLINVSKERVSHQCLKRESVSSMSQKRECLINVKSLIDNVAMSQELTSLISISIVSWKRPCLLLSTLETLRHWDIETFWHCLMEMTLSDGNDNVSTSQEYWAHLTCPVSAPMNCKSRLDIFGTWDLMSPDSFSCLTNLISIVSLSISSTPTWALLCMHLCISLKEALL